MFQRILNILLLLLPAIVFADGVWETQTHDFGAFDEDMGVVYCEFRLVNEGAEPISIMSARANCGCTRPEYSTAPVAPGDTAVIRVGYDPKGRPGRFQKQVTVDCSAPPLRTRLTICGTVIGSGNTLRSRFPVEAGPVRMRTTTIPYGKVLKGKSPGQYVEAYNASSDTIRPKVISSPKYINVIVQPATVPPGEQFILSTIFHTDATREWGILTDSILLSPSGTSGEEPLKIETVAIVSEDFSRLTDEQRAKAPHIDTSVTALDLERVSRTDSPSRHYFEIINRGKTPLIIRRISCPDPAVTVTLKETKIKPGKKARVDVSVDPSKIGRTELLNARINIIANDPDNPSTMVRVVAEVKD
ncbi:MAG: DUF1573 domain-containing protein [Muribaculaceae bacterium]|nr:DUF1573 domain-containing protein [Muribaculaceae bacterium]